ncbi:hypothetical protein QQ045_002692 [Rhodiola kirilowii]
MSASPLTSSAPLLLTPMLYGNMSPHPQQLMYHPPEQAQSGKVLRIDVPVFQGEAVDGWLFQMERYFEHNRVILEQQMTIATFFMGGEALKWYQWMYATHQITDWFHFAHDVKQQFGPSVYYKVEVALNKLFHTTSVAKYIADFESLSTRMPSFTPELLLHRFMAGLKEDVHNETALLCSTNLSMAMGMARLAEQKINIGKWSSSRPHGNLSTSSSTFPGACHTRQAKPSPRPNSLPIKHLTNAELAERRSKGLCFKCDEKYTASHKCKPRFLCMAMEEDEESSGGEEEPPGAKEECEEQGAELTPNISFHALQGCPVPRTLRLEGALAGRKVIILVDGGSTHNFVQSRIAKHAGLVVEVIRHLSVTVGELRCEGVCKGVELVMGGKRISVARGVILLEILTGKEAVSEKPSTSVEDYYMTNTMLNAILDHRMSDLFLPDNPSQ